MTAASVTSVIAALLVIGIFFIIVMNVDHAATTLESQIEMMVYLNDGLSPNIIESMMGEVKTLDGVKAVSFISKADALKKLKNDWGDNAYILEGLEEENPLPDALVVQLTDPSRAGHVSLTIGAMSNIEKVFYGKEELEKILKATYMLRMGSIFIVLTLILIAVIIIANTIKLTVYSRRKEIGIMKYIGATDWFVRGPFVAEGIVIGFLGGVLSTLLLGSAYYYGVNLIRKQMIGFLSISLLPLAKIIMPLTIMLLFVGIVIGAVGSLMSVRKFVRV